MYPLFEKTSNETNRDETVIDFVDEKKKQNSRFRGQRDEARRGVTPSKNKTLHALAAEKQRYINTNLQKNRELNP